MATWYCGIRIILGVGTWPKIWRLNTLIFGIIDAYEPLDYTPNTVYRPSHCLRQVFWGLCVVFKSCRLNIWQGWFIDVYS